MATVSLALMWHQHQPYYPDDVAGENPMPWVRLHATKDYLGMALHLEEVPELFCTINLVPSLLAQLDSYANGGSDQHLRLSRLPADGLGDDDARAILDQFFMAFPDSMIRPHPRYHDLFMSRSAWSLTAAQALSRFRPRDFRDLQVWSNLAWIHPLLFEKDPELAEFKAKGHHYTEGEKQWFLDKQRALVARVIPAHRELAARGQVELTTSPYYHPILPLLLDKTAAREAMPEVVLPAYRGGYTEDAAAQVRMGVESHMRHFGEQPRGMWPSEGSVSQALIPLLAEHGFEWIATDEEILGCSTGGKIGRDSRGHVRHPELLYRPWKVREGASELGIVFRDHSMSDQIGFLYRIADLGPGGGGRFHGKAGGHRRCVPAQLSDARAGDSRRRKLLGVLPRRRRLIPPLALPGGCQEPARPPGQDPKRNSCASIRRSTACTGCSREAGSAITSQSGSVIPKTIAAGTPSTTPDRSWWKPSGPRAIPRRQSPAPGMKSLSPRAPIGSGGTETIIRAHSTACSITCSANISATSTHLLQALDPPGSLFAPISRHQAKAAAQPANQLLRGQVYDGRARRPNGSAPRLRLRQRPRNHDPRYPRPAGIHLRSASTPSGSWSGSTPKAGRAEPP